MQRCDGAQTKPCLSDPARVRGQLPVALVMMNNSVVGGGDIWSLQLLEIKNGMSRPVPSRLPPPPTPPSSPRLPRANVLRGGKKKCLFIFRSP